MPRNYLDCEQEGIAKAKFDFIAKTPVELPLKKVCKSEHVTKCSSLTISLL